MTNGSSSGGLPQAILALQRSAGNAAVSELVQTGVQRAPAATAPPMSQEALAEQLQGDVEAIKSELDSPIYTEGVEEAVISLLRKRAELPMPPPPEPTYLDRLFERLQESHKRKALVFSTTYYDAMLDDFDRLAELRALRDGACRWYRGRESKSAREEQQKESAKRQESEVEAEQEGGWGENVGVDTPIPKTPETVGKAKMLVRELESKRPLTRQQIAVSRRIAVERDRGGDGTEWMFHGVHFITDEERNRWKKELAGKVVITMLMVVGAIVTEGLIEMFAPDLLAAIVGADTEAGAAEATEVGEEGAAGEATEEEIAKVRVHRGQAPGVPTVTHGQVIHDFGDGLYLTDSEEVAELYAKTRGAQVGSQGEVLSAELEPKVFGKVLDLRSDPRWAEFVKRPAVPGGSVTNEALMKLANENYNPLFQGFLRENGIELESYDTVIGPEYVRGGNQICIRNPEIASHVRSVLKAKP